MLAEETGNGFAFGVLRTPFRGAVTVDLVFRQSTGNDGVSHDGWGAMFLRPYRIM